MLLKHISDPLPPIADTEPAIQAVVNRALAGEVLVTDTVCGAIAGSERLELDPIGQVKLKGFPEPTELFVVRAP